MHTANYHRRAKTVFFVFFILLLTCIVRLSFIQSLSSGYLASIAQKQHNLFVELEPRRGTVYDVNLKPQAVNIAADSLFASPAEMKDADKQKAITKLSSILNLDYSYLKERFLRKKSFVWIARKITAQQSEEIKNLNIRGLGFIKETKRCYPNMYLASHVIGFAGLDNKGLEGIELSCDKYLKGETGWATMLRDARQKRLDIYEKIYLPRDGYDIVLTIDEVIQYIAERELDNVFKTYHAKGASIVVMNPYTGEILAIANRPTYDLNQYAQTARDSRRNRAVCDLFEPGSVFKIVTASAALEENAVKEEDRFFCENGSYRVANHILHDHQSHGWLTFREVIEESSNIGTTKVAQMLGPEVVYKYVKLFGFGSKTGIDVLGEISGMIKQPKFWSKTSIGAVPIGQEVGVTAIQLVSAISAIANGGQLVKPYIIKEIRDKNGETIKKFSPTLIHQVISPEISARVKDILIGVVNNGTGQLAKMEEFSAAGKTGTAQKVEANGTYSHDKFVASFIGFAPAENPAIAIVVTVDEPHPTYYGGVVSAPVFKKVAQEVLKYLKVKNHSIGDMAKLN